MEKELDEYLVKRYPDIFRNRHGNMTETAMCWGFECGDGWFNILNNACSLITNHIKFVKEKNEETKKYLEKIEKGEIVHDWVKKSYENGDLLLVKDPSFLATQVKEKFGTLRFYYSGGDDYIDGVVSMAEAMSGATCEECGSPGKTDGSGWISTRCKEHSKSKEEASLKVVGDTVRALGLGKFEEILITEVISEDEVIGKIIAEEDWDNEKKEYVVKETSEKFVKLKHIKNKIRSYWNIFENVV